MTDLPISGMLDVAVDQASLRAAQQEIEENVGQLSMGVDAGGGQTSTRGVEGREQAMARALATEANDIAEEQAEWLELIYLEIADEGSGDLFDTGEGGGVFGFLRDFGDDAGDVGGAAALTGAAAALTASAKTSTGLHAGAAAALTTAAGSLMASNLFGDNGPLHVEVPDELDPVLVDTPTLGVDDPSPLTVDEPMLGVDDSSPLDVDPDYIAPVDDTAIPVDPSVDVNISGGGPPVSSDGDGPGRLQLLQEEEWPVIGPTAERINDAGENFFSSTPLGRLPSRSNSSQGDAGRAPPTQQTTTVTNNVTTDVEVTADGDRWKRDLRREYERQIEEIERRLRDVERRFDRA